MLTFVVSNVVQKLFTLDDVDEFAVIIVRLFSQNKFSFQSCCQSQNQIFNLDGSKIRDLRFWSHFQNAKIASFGHYFIGCYYYFITPHHPIPLHLHLIVKSKFHLNPHLDLQKLLNAAKIYLSDSGNTLYQPK